MKDKKFLTLTSMFFLLFAAAMTTILFNKPTSQILRAKNSVPSPLKSFVIIFPQLGVAGTTKLKVSVFMRDVSGNVLADRSVKLTSNPSNLNITPSDTMNTDNIGQAQFFITSETAGKVTLAVTDVASNTSISSVPTVEFTQ